MSGIGLFIVGLLVTLIVVAAIGLLMYAAILDGRDAAARKADEREPPAPPRAVDILQTARAAGSFDTLITAIERTGLSECWSMPARTRCSHRAMRRSRSCRSAPSNRCSRLPTRSPTSWATTSWQGG